MVPKTVIILLFFSSKERPTSHSPRNVSQLCSHDKFISTDGNWQDLTNHKDMPDHKGVWQGCLFREEGWLFLFRKWVDDVFRHFSGLIHKILGHPRDPNRRCPDKKKDVIGDSWQYLQKNIFMIFLDKVFMNIKKGTFLCHLLIFSRVQSLSGI